MAKGRKLTTSRSERFLGAYGNSNGNGYFQNHSSIAADPSELREEDIWSTADDSGDGDHDLNLSEDWDSPKDEIAETNGGSSYRNRRRITQNSEEIRQLGGLSLAFEDPASNVSTATSTARIVHQFRAHESAAVAASSRGRQMATSLPVNVPDWSKILRVDSVESLHDDSVEDDDLEMVPPHEYLARSRKMAAKSVFEGVGRTLKGRDLSRVRDAVWSQTGFDG